MSERLHEAFAGGAGEVAGRKWAVRVIAAGWSLNGIYYSPEVLRRAVEARVFDGIPVKAYMLGSELNHVPDRLARAAPALAGNIVGIVRSPRWDEASRAIIADVELYDSPHADGIRRLAASAWAAGDRELLGFSIDGEHESVAEGLAEGKRGRISGGIRACQSLDLVSHPAAGGRFLRLVAALRPEESTMKAKLLEAIKALDAALLEGIDIEKATEEDLFALYQANAGKKPAAAEAAKAPPPAAPAAREAVVSQAEWETWRKRQETRVLAEKRITEARLPRVTAEELRALDWGTLDAAGIDARIEAERARAQRLAEELGATGGVARGLGYHKPIAGSDVRDPHEVKLDRVFLTYVGPGYQRMTEEDKKRCAGLRPYRGLRELLADLAGYSVSDEPYVRAARATEAAREFGPEASDRLMRAWLGDLRLPGSDASVYDGIRAARAAEGVATVAGSYFSDALTGTANRALIFQLLGIEQPELDLATFRNVPDFRAVKTDHYGHYAAFGTVTEGSSVSDGWSGGAPTEATATGTPLEYGALYAISRKAMYNDDLGYFRKIPELVARAGTLKRAQLFWDMFLGYTSAINDTNIYTGSVPFTSANKNATALSPAGVIDLINKIALRKDIDSRCELGMRADTLIVPIELTGTAREILDSEGKAAEESNTANVLRGRLKLIVVPTTLLRSDTTNYYVVASPASVPEGFITMAVPDGRTQPVLLAQTGALEGDNFDKGNLRYVGRWDGVFFYHDEHPVAASLNP